MLSGADTLFVLHAGHRQSSGINHEACGEIVLKRKPVGPQ